MSNGIVVERQVTAARLAELGIHGWPTWKDGVGQHLQDYDAAEKSYLLDGSATLSMEDGEPVDIEKGDLVIIGRQMPVARAQPVRRHYRSDALSPACCII